MRINHNTAAMNTYSRLSSAQGAQAKSLEKLSSGLRINRAGDDAAGLAISEKMRGQISGLNQASRNAQDGISLIQTAEGGLNETHSILQRMRELAVQSSNDTNTDTDRVEIQEEMNQLSEEVSRISSNTQFNSKNLLDGDFSAKFHIGANKGQNMQLDVSDMSAQALKVSGSGEGKATYEEAISLTAGSGDAKSLVAGKQTLDVVSLDNVVMSDTTANYGLANSDGDIVAVSNDGASYKLLTEATESPDLATATTTDSLLEPATGKVTSGQIEVDVALTTGAVSGIGAATATSSVEVKGLDTGDYKTVTIDVSSFGEYFNTDGADGKIAITGTTAQLVHGDIDSLLLNENDEAVAVKFDGVDNYFSVKDVDFTAEGASAGAATIAAAIDSAEAVVTQPTGDAFDNGEVLSISANGGIDVSSQVAADAAIETIDNAISTVSAERSKLGAVQNRLDHTINNLTTTSENLSAAESRIRDVDMAKEMMEFTKNNILNQASTAMLAQANQMPQGVLQLLG